MGKLNRPAFGLQDLLGNTAQGKNPDEFLDAVRGSVDLWPLLAMDRFAVSQTRIASGFSAIGNNIFVEVPDGEIWIPTRQALHAIGLVAANTTLGVTLGINNYTTRFGGLTDVVFWGTDGGRTAFQLLNINEQHTWSSTYKQKAVFQSGTRFIAEVCENSLGNNFDVTLSVEYWRLEI